MIFATLFELFVVMFYALCLLFMICVRCDGKDLIFGKTVNCNRNFHVVYLKILRSFTAMSFADGVWTCRQLMEWQLQQLRR